MWQNLKECIASEPSIRVKQAARLELAALENALLRCNGYEQGAVQLTDEEAMEAYGRGMRNARPGFTPEQAIRAGHGEVAKVVLARCRARITEGIAAMAINAARTSSEPAIYGPSAAQSVILRALGGEP